MIDVDLTGKVALVTGGSRGLGKEMVTAFARCGADVMITSRRVEACEALAEEIRSATGRKAYAHGCHIGHWEEIDGLVEAAYGEFGRVDILVNNAGMAPLYPSLAEVTEELFDKVIGVNLKGPFRLSALVGERMAAGDGGRIVNISSLAAVHPGRNDIPYAAAKAGLNNLTAGLAITYGPAVRANGVMVGPFLTDISKAWDVDGFKAFAAERYPLGRLAEPEEIVGTALYLASDASSFMTGHVLTLDGGINVTSPFPS
ncbi:MAG TPA: glucose 1-dehydrogenase [Acidimicrobiales bacterium]|jgi:NAD(P)-dependent dehydrogenase (short-subunit alcohol dehydrogenase family)|nr:glucose 1-dehydrogenase [Acidimicrobiales bacterium]